jgi:hypothetical protein
MNITRALSIARLVLAFGQVRRVTLHEDGEPESDTTHRQGEQLAAQYPELLEVRLWQARLDVPAARLDVPAARRRAASQPRARAS